MDISHKIGIPIASVPSTAVESSQEEPAHLIDPEALKKWLNLQLGRLQADGIQIFPPEYGVEIKTDRDRADFRQLTPTELADLKSPETRAFFKLVQKYHPQFTVAKSGILALREFLVLKNQLNGSPKQLAGLERILSLCHTNLENEGVAAIRDLKNLRIDCAAEAVPAGRAETLYQALNENWQLKKIEARSLLQVLADADRYEFFMNPRNAKKFHALKNRFGAGPDSLAELYDVERLVHAFDVLSRPEIYEAMRRFYPVSFTAIPGQLTPVISYSDLCHFARFSAIVETPVSFLEVAKALEDHYGVPPDTAGRLLRHLVIDKKTVKLFRDPETGSSFQQLSAMGFDLLERKNFETLIKTILPDERVGRCLKNRDFIAYCQRLQHSAGETLHLRQLPEIADFYEQGQMNPGLAEIPFLPQFGAMIDYLRGQFALQISPLTVLPAVAHLAHRAKLAKLRERVEALKQSGERVEANDLILLAELEATPTLHERFYKEHRLDRQVLEAAIKQIYDRHPNVQFRDPVASDRIHLKTMEEKGIANGIAYWKDRIKKTEEKFSGYNERPDPSCLPALAMVRIILLEELLNAATNPVIEQTVRDFGELVSEDIHDEQTEYGGIIGIRDGKIKFSPVLSSAEDNNQYNNARSPLLIDGVANFHLHALGTDRHAFAGPSGWLDSGSGDIAVVDNNRGVGVVLTTLGHPQDGSGQEIRDRLKINVDLYFVDERSAESKAVRIIDLGIYELPYTSKK